MQKCLFSKENAGSKENADSWNCNKMFFMFPCSSPQGIMSFIEVMHPGIPVLSVIPLLILNYFI